MIEDDDNNCPSKNIFEKMMYTVQAWRFSRLLHIIPGRLRSFSFLFMGDGFFGSLAVHLSRVVKSNRLGLGSNRDCLRRLGMGMMLGLIPQ